MGDFEQMGKVAKEITHTRTPLSNCEPIVIIMLDLGKKEKEKKNERDDFISYLVRKKTEYLYKIP